MCKDIAEPLDRARVRCVLPRCSQGYGSIDINASQSAIRLRAAPPAAIGLAEVFGTRGAVCPSNPWGGSVRVGPVEDAMPRCKGLSIVCYGTIPAMPFALRTAATRSRRPPIAYPTHGSVTPREPTRDGPFGCRGGRTADTANKLPRQPLRRCAH